MPGAREELTPGVTVLGNVAVDRVDGRPPSPGGCPTFVSPVLRGAAAARIVTRVGEAERGIFDEVFAGASVELTVLPSSMTSRFGLQYTGDSRQLTVDRVGPRWDSAEIAAANVATEWVHVAPLLRTDFTPAAIAALVSAGHRVSLDGQGLVRRPDLGPLQLDGGFDPALLRGITVLKLADDEADLVTGGHPFGRGDAAELGVPEVVVTYGSKGCDVFAGGERHHVPASPKVLGVQATGAGDVFTTAYVVARSRGEAPPEAATEASGVAASFLLARRERG